ncbi:HAMP domain-containing sensor histidine kinase [Nocardioides sp.]|uniref:sensor histidine kinase n=1 Tax=Nocardioides sp. TaxID=35761 RepID=UPI0027293823|nr:HAMP domain-containing sensor histidine kinase [Nocardioides sp.]MDO9457595.1 HAMP domain-containing sensor histidine kinase [Nocardioides sp.]
MPEVDEAAAAAGVRLAATVDAVLATARPEGLASSTVLLYLLNSSGSVDMHASPVASGFGPSMTLQLDALLDAVLATDATGRQRHVRDETMLAALRPPGGFVRHGDRSEPGSVLLAPLHGDRRHVIGYVGLGIEGPDGMPTPTDENLLAGLAEHLGEALNHTYVAHRTVERAGLAVSARHVVMRAAAQTDVAAVLDEAALALSEVLTVDGAWYSCVAVATTTVSATAGRLARLPGAVVDRLTRQLPDLATRAWDDQRVAVLSRARTPLNPPVSYDHDRTLADLAEAGLASVVVVPVGVGDVTLGCLALVRSDAHPSWSSAEADMLLALGRDLGHVITKARAFATITRANEELYANDRYRSELVATVAHELGTPLTVINAHLELLAEATGDGDLAMSTSAIRRSTERMSALVSDLLALTRYTPHEHAAAHELVDVGETVDLVLADLEATADLQTVTLVHLGAPPTARVLATAVELRHAIANVVGNAIKYSDAGGLVIVRTDCTATDVVLTVQDRGIGISPDDQARLFQEFFRSDDPRARQRPGTGLGLAIVDRVLRRMDASISVDSDPFGTTFTMRFPLPDS